jgi:hypothetical protein
MPWHDTVTAVATCVAAAAAIGAVVVARCGLEDTAKQLRGTTLYQIARDGKALEARYLGTKGGTTTDSKNATEDEVMSYFDSIHRLYNSGVLDDASWFPIRNALCRFAKYDGVPEWWKSHEDAYEEGFRGLVNEMELASKCPPP